MSRIGSDSWSFKASMRWCELSLSSHFLGSKLNLEIYKVSLGPVGTYWLYTLYTFV